MSLFDMFMEECIEMKAERSPDGLGGFKTAWVEGVNFHAAVIKNNTLAASVAEKQGVTEIYTVTTPPGVGLKHYEVFKRKRDGATFRVTSNAEDTKPPKMASFSFEQVKAERWELV